MSIKEAPVAIRTSELFNHIDMGFLNRRLAISALGPVRNDFLSKQCPGEDHMTVLGNDHLLVTMLIDVFNAIEAPTLCSAMMLGKPRHVFMSTERLKSCPDIYEEERVTHEVFFEFEIKKPVKISYHTSHLVSSTGKMTLSLGYEEGYVESILGLLHDKEDCWEIEPIVIGAPWLDHSRNSGPLKDHLMFFGQNYGEILPEDIDQFKELNDVAVTDASEWMDAMRSVPELKVKEVFADLLCEPTKKDWGGEENDHFSSNVVVGDRRHTAAFLLKGPSNFKEMTIAMCGKNGDQIYRLVNSGADISVVQHSHMIGSAVRETVRQMVVSPGRTRRFCIIDGQSTYRILKAYGYL